MANRRQFLVAWGLSSAGLAGCLQLQPNQTQAGGNRPGLTFKWGTLYVPAEDGTDHPQDERHLAFGCRGLVIIGEDEWLARFDVGENPAPVYEQGVYDVEGEGDMAFRWFGGSEGLTRIRFPETDLSSATEVMLVGFLPEIDKQQVTVYKGETVTDERVLTTASSRQYRFSTTV